MIRTIVAACAALAFSLPANAATIEIESEGPVIELSVFESVTAEPDLATISAGVSTTAPTAVEALRQNSVEMTRMIDQIKALGVDEKDIQTTGINLNARYDYNRGTQRNEFRGYQVSNRVSVKLREIEQTGRVLDALVSAGATDLGGPSFSIEDDEAAKDEARKRAVERAQERAQAYAAMLGYDEVRVLEISESLRGRGPVADVAMRSAMVAEAAPAPPVQPGMVSTGVSITIKFEMAEDDEDAEEDEG
ncbi:MAG: SIMPL domain-containing protein [Erythrobacter sp.]|nr:SIMPL domain-containing protein [Erythrobacter sp.]